MGIEDSGEISLGARSDDCDGPANEPKNAKQNYTRAGCPVLAKVIEDWLDLPNAIKEAILTMVVSISSKAKEERHERKAQETCDGSGLSQGIPSATPQGLSERRRLPESPADAIPG